MKSGQNINMALMNIRATPVSNNIPSPAELLMKRKLPHYYHPDQKWITSQSNIKCKTRNTSKCCSTTKPQPQMTCPHCTLGKMYEFLTKHQKPGAQQQ